MKRNSLLFVLLCALLAPWAANAQEIVTIGEGTNSTNQVPIGTYYNYSLSEQLYTADEIGMAGAIQSIGFNYALSLAKDFPIQVYMKNVTESNLATAIALDDATLVFDGTYSVTGTGWATIELDTPFEYDGSSNLLIGVIKGYLYYFSGSSWYATSATSMARCIQDDYSALSLSDITSSYTTSYRPNIQLSIVPSGDYCAKPTLAVSGITHNQATITWGEGSGTYNVQWKGTSEENWHDIASNTTTTTYQLTALEPITTYEARVQGVCGNNVSDWKTVSFTTTAQIEEVGDSWADDFEGATCGWERLNGELTNKWIWGTTTNHGGSHALYISNDDGANNDYTLSSATTVYATKYLNFTEGKFEFAYDWKANGESNYDFLRVALVPASLTLTPSTVNPCNSFNTTLPEGWIAVDGGSKLNLVTEWQRKSVAVDVPAGNYYLVFAWRNDASGGTTPPAAVDNVSITRMACEHNVTDLTEGNITTNSATLTWTGGEAEQWQVEYADNNSFDHATTAIVSEATYTMTNLSAATTYYVRVRAYCGGEDFGAWCDAISFITECEAITQYPYTENFDSYTTSTGFLPLCWDRINTGTSYYSYPYVYNYSYNAHSGSNYLYFNSYGSSSTTTLSDQYAVLPAMENLAGKMITLYAIGYNAQCSFKIGTMTDPTDVTTFSQIASQALTTSYQEFSYIVPADNTASHIAIMMERANGSSYTTWSVYIDDITVDFPPTCPKPTGLAVTANSVTAHAANITWTENGEATNWSVEYDTDADFPDPVIEEAEDEATYTFSGLTPETTYYVRVKALCGADDESEYSNVVSFTTTISCPAPTGLAVTDISAYAATLNWTGTSESYTVSYRTAAYTEGLGETFSGSSLPSGWENKSGLLSNVMSGTALTSTSQWVFGTNSGVFDQHARINIYGTARYGWLISPAFTVLEGLPLTFDLALTAYSYNETLSAPSTTGTDDKFVVLISTDNEATWTILRQWDNEEGSTYVYNEIASTAEGEQVSIDLSNYVGQSVRIAFYGESTVNNADNNLHIDNVNCGISHEAGQWQTVTVTEPTATLTGLSEETAYQAKVQGNCGEDGLSEETSIINFTTDNACPTPTNLIATNVTANTADLSWNGSVDVESYTVRYRTVEHIINGINETFDAATAPSNWSMYTGLLSDVMNGTELTPVSYGWTFGTGNGVFDSHARVNIYGTYQRWLATPNFTLAASTFTFDLALTAYSGTNVPAPATTGTDDKFAVLISTNGGTTWTILRQWDNEEGSTYVYNEIANTAEGEQVSIDLSSYVGQTVCIAFYGESTVSNADNNLHIDNVVIGNPTVVPAGDWQTASSTTNSLTLTDLSPITPYEAQVKSACSDPEEWSNTATFTTTVPTTVTQTIALNAGINWVSFYVNVDLNELKTALVAAVSTSNPTINIKSQTQNVKYQRGRWVGQLEALDMAQMYIIDVPEACNITFEGTAIDPSTLTVTLNNGANYIAFPFNQSMSLAEFFGSFPINNDQAKSQLQNTKYRNGRWAGSLTELQPGQGYIYVSSDENPRTFTFPTSK